MLPYSPLSSISFVADENFITQPSMDLFFSETKQKIDLSLALFRDFSERHQQLSVPLSHLNIANR